MTQVIEGIARKEWICNFTDCRKKISKGQEYLLWHVQGTARRQHTEHGQPTVKPATKKTTKAAAKVTKKKATKKKATKGGKK